MNDVIIVNWGGRQRELRFGHKAQKTFERLSGKPMQQLDTDTLGGKELEMLIYCFMISDAVKHSENLKLEDMEDILDEVTPYSDILRVMGEVIEATFPAPEPANEENTEKN